MIGWYHAQLGDLRQALRYCQRAADLQLAQGDGCGEAYSLGSLGHIHHRLGRHQAAVGRYRRALALIREVDDRRQEADLLTHLGDAQHAAGEGAPAAESWRQALSILEQLRHPDAAGVPDRLRCILGERLTSPPEAP
jgi:tetratricopeptide (TPR) repeat protein